MGGFNPINSLIGTVTDTIGLTQSARDADRSYNQARALYDQQAREIAQESKAQRNALALDAAKAETDRRDALRRASAKQRATFGGQGISADEGSGEAVLLGLLQDSEAEKSYRDRLDDLKRRTIAQDTDNKNRRNLLSLNNSYQNTYNRLLDSSDTILGKFSS